MRPRAVPLRAVAELARRDQRNPRVVEQLGDEVEPLLLDAELEQLLLRLRRQLDLCRELERELRRRLVRVVGVGAGERGERAERSGRAKRGLGIDVAGIVFDLADLRGHERAPARESLDPEAQAALDENGQPPVVEPLEHFRDRRARPDLANPVLVGVHEPELLVRIEALADQLLIARLEDVQRHPLGREQDDAEREEADLRHRPKGTRRQ